ncbi:epoxide hydrolase N-terminal domain-containing protein [Pseudomonas uvaldensis]|uniref:epoxide hydrolase N-terminal domain-containing protein n=1 Tax=Pseudomonas uvaldensis TaxID=2878385 RepID=UPI001E52E930|nr:epoxide hydrolase N-terminal domain-containing protein [Pseudomonas uvaldensis]MCE0464146.1 epoxide hydrolase N-terminal domain-containing protein [Pseudomonas uvaldensis]
MLIEPFCIDVPESALDDLRRRLQHTRLPEPLADQGWSEGMNMDVPRELLAYWSTSFDWFFRPQRQSLW